MGMTLTLLQVNSATLEEYLNDSSLLENVLFEGVEDDIDDILDLDKSWDGIFFLLTGESSLNSEHKLLKLFYSDNVIDDEQDFGYGPAFYLLPEEVKEINSELLKMSISDLKKRFDPDKMEALGLYPEIWHDEESLPYLLDNFEELKAFYATAAKRGNIIISVLS
jgi:hypothetical protein